MPKYVKGLFLWNHSHKIFMAPGNRRISKGEEFPCVGSSVDDVPEVRGLEEDQQLIATNVYK